MAAPDRVSSGASGMIFRTVLLLAAGVVSLALLAPHGGLRAVYSAETAAGALVPLQTRLDPAVDFPAPELLDQPFFQHWNLQALGVPAALPPFQVRWTGLLDCPSPGLYRFHVEAAGKVRMLLDGAPLVPEAGNESGGVARELSAGWHALDLTYRREDEAPEIRLLWEPPGAAGAEVVPRRALAPSRAALDRALAASWAGGVLAAALALLALRIWRRRRQAGSLGAFLLEHRHGVALAVLLLLGAALRLYQYDLIPFHHETADEYQHGWQGWNLLHQGAPRAWTFYPWIYPEQDRFPLTWYGDPYHIVQPYFDHPPGFAILVGGVSTLLGARQMLECTLWRMRPVPILLGLLTLYLVARVGWLVFEKRLAGTLAALVYATLPTLVLGNRLVKAESLVAPLLLMLVIWLERYCRQGRRRDLAALAAGGFAAMWAKATGIAYPAAALILLAARRRWKAAAVVAGVAAAAVLAYLAYGAFYDWGLFTAVLELQSSKRVAVRTLLDLAGISRVVELQFGTGWYLWLALATGALALGRHRRVLAPAAVYFLVLALTADSRSVFGWYRLPLYPFLCLAGGKFLADWWEEKDLTRSFLFGVTALATTFYHALPLGAERSRAAVAAVFALSCAAPLAVFLLPSLAGKRLRRAGVVLSLAAFLAGNIEIVHRQVEVYLQEAARGKVPTVAGAPAAGRDAGGGAAGATPPGPGPGGG